jgi:2-oxoglutarate dehydrogenase E2 component (dihydrolipoamide succinyltransferase)
MGTPIIVQPQVGILAFGVIEKKPAVVTDSTGDSVQIRQKMFISHSYDHRVVDGTLGGGFLKRVSDYLEKFEMDEF